MDVIQWLMRKIVEDESSEPVEYEKLSKAAKQKLIPRVVTDPGLQRAITAYREVSGKSIPDDVEIDVMPMDDILAFSTTRGTFSRDGKDGVPRIEISPMRTALAPTSTNMHTLAHELQHHKDFTDYGLDKYNEMADKRLEYEDRPAEQRASDAATEILLKYPKQKALVEEEYLDTEVPRKLRKGFISGFAAPVFDAHKAAMMKALGR